MVIVRPPPPAEPMVAVHLRVPVSLVAEVDALVGDRFEHRSAVVRRLIRVGLESIEITMPDFRG
jgi:Arc/MetJ-type ribon-helix-helix transcriptional regulator